jgi:hypothetical protein
MAEDEDVLVFVEFLMGAAGNLAHGDEGAAFDVGELVLHGLADVEQQWRFRCGEQGLGGFYGEFEVHRLRIPSCSVPLA